MDLVYDNGVTVTAAPLGTCSADVLRLAYRSSAPKSHYLLAELDQVAGRLTTWDENGTVTLDLATGKSSAVESPDAQHSCSFLHCFNTAMKIAWSAPLYGWLSDKICDACLGAVAEAWIAVTPLGEALLGVPCVACLATLTASVVASIWVCKDDSCSLCMSDSCGESDAASGANLPIVCGTPRPGFNPDPETGSTAGRYSIENEAYVCQGITTSHEYFWFGDQIPEYRGTQCVQSGHIIPWERCKYGCASPAPSETESRTCKPAPLVCDPARCTGTTVTAGTQTCSLQTDGTYAVTRQVGVNACVPAAYPNEQVCGITGWTTETVGCGACGCADGTSCRCLAGQPRGDPWCQRATGTASQYEVVQEQSRCDWIAASQQCLESTETVRVAWCGAAGCNGNSCGTATATPRPTPTATATPTATQCDPNTCKGTVVLATCALNPPRYQTGTLTRVSRTSICVGAECRSVDVPLPPSICAEGCNDNGTWCAGGSRGGGCVPSECEQPDEPIGDPRCVFRPDDQKWILERDYRYSACSPAAGGDNATCEQTTITKLEQMCPAGCGADLRSCASAGSVPAAPSEFAVRQRPEGTAFSWRDNATNETGYHIFFGSRSLGEPAELLTDVKGMDAVGMIIPWKRTGGATCWELYAYNAVGESAPARYCLPG